MEVQPQPPITPAADNGKTVGIVSYLTLIGWIVALVMHSSNKTSFGAFHLRQGLMNMIMLMAASIVAIIPILGWIVYLAALIAWVVFIIMGAIAASNGQEKPLPLIGGLAQKWFGNAFN
jgi:uncharacterized membrane protein